MISMKSPTHRVVLLLLGVVGHANAFAALTGEQLAAKGTSAGAPSCTTCHGPTGQGQAAAGFPRLASMDAKYLARQLAAFADGSRVNPIMGPVAKLLTAPEMTSVSEFYAGIPAMKQPGDGPTAPVTSEGTSLALKGDWSNGLPACSQCHGPDGLGVGASFPQLAGQSAAYLKAQITAWKTGARKGEPLGLMQGVASKLSDAQVSAVTDFYASLPAAAARSSKVKP